jgi:hypothetical protein
MLIYQRLVLGIPGWSNPSDELTVDKMRITPETQRRDIG